MLFEGFVELNKIERVKTVIETATKKACTFDTKKPKPAEKIPTLLKNPKLIKPFEIFIDNLSDQNMGLPYK